MSNRITLVEFDTMKIGDIAQLPVDQLALLAEDIESAEARAKRQAQWLAGALGIKYGEREAALRRAAGGTTGTVTIDDGDFAIKATAAKKVSWDQAGLAAAVHKLLIMGENPGEYVETQYSVSETRYGAWPEAVRSIFAGARTLAVAPTRYAFRRKGGK